MKLMMVLHNLNIKSQLLSCVQIFVTPWTVACQVTLSMEFSRQEFWNGLPFPSPRDLPDPGNKPGSPALWANSLLSEPPGKPTDGKGVEKSLALPVTLILSGPN